jgi:hypothetical protein
MAQLIAAFPGYSGVQPHRRQITDKANLQREFVA